MIGTTQTKIVARRENAPQKLPRKTQVRAAVAPKFCDAAHWDELAAERLPRYDLPAWDAPCEPVAMRRWLDRLNVTEAEYMRRTGTSLADFCELNPEWPLRAWIGTVLEMHEEAQR